MIILLALVGIFYYWPNKVDFKPFFKTDSSIPESTLFDIGILKVCGDWGEKPDKEDFRILLDCAHNKDTVQRIYDELEHQVITPQANLELFKDELTQIWFTTSNFKEVTTVFRHVFCGEPGKSSLGGMHFVGRYVQAQENKWAGGVENNNSLCNQSNTKPPVYTFGMKYLRNDGKVGVKCPNGYAYNLHADDILISATKAFKEIGKDGMCLYEMKEDQYHSVFVRKNNGILTFYPDLTPKCSDGRTHCNCHSTEN